MRCADFGPTPGKQRNALISSSRLEGVFTNTSTNLLRGLIASLHSTRSIAYLHDMSQSLRSVRLVFKPLAAVLEGVDY